MRVLIGGDFCPQERVAQLIEAGMGHEVFADVTKVVSDADYSIVNLECPIVEHWATPIEKCGPNLKATSVAVDAIKDAGFQCVTLGNNHIYDYSDEGIEETIRVLEQKNLDYVGAGGNISEASKVLYKQIGESVLAVINACETEFSIASKDTGGANPLNPVHLYGIIQEARQQANYVLLIVHGGVEHYALPTCRMKDLYHFFVDVGVDAVVNHHQHCYTGYEIYKGKPIFYGLGNFCFDSLCQRRQSWKEGFMVVLGLGVEENPYELIPYIQCDVEAKVSLMSKDEKLGFEEKIEDLNTKIVDDSILFRCESEFMEKTKDEYLLALEPYGNRLLRGLYRRRLLPSFISEKRRLQLLNNIVCESHRDRLIHAIKYFNH